MNTIMIGDAAPNFTAETVNGLIDMYQYKKDKWLLFCSHPADFTPVCDGELCTMQNWKNEFDGMNVKLMGLSIDSIDSHMKWFQQFKEIDDLSFDFPIIADETRGVAELYGMIRKGQTHSKTARSMFIIDNNNIVRLTAVYPAEVGRNFKEIIRTIKALQLVDKYPIATPVNWKEGAEVVVHPTLDVKDYAHKFPNGVRTVKPYLKFVSL